MGMADLLPNIPSMIDKQFPLSGLPRTAGQPDTPKGVCPVRPGLAGSWPNPDRADRRGLSGLVRLSGEGVAIMPSDPHTQIHMR